MGKYDDIINMPVHFSVVHPRMSVADRAAQFASFAALDGHSEAVAEEGRLTCERPVFDEDKAAALDEKLQKAISSPGREIKVTCFIPDDKKPGGAYVTICGALRTADEYEGKLILSDKTEISFKNIWDIEL